MLVGDFHAKVGKASQPDDIIGQYVEDKENTDGLEMLKLLAKDEMKTKKRQITTVRGAVDMDQKIQRRERTLRS